jgi:hypothetical protein
MGETISQFIENYPLWWVIFVPILITIWIVIYTLRERAELRCPKCEKNYGLRKSSSWRKIGADGSYELFEVIYDYDCRYCGYTKQERKIDERKKYWD